MLRLTVKVTLADLMPPDAVLSQAGARGILFQYGNLYYPQRDIDERDLRAAVVGDGEKLLCAMLHSADAMAAAAQRKVLFIAASLLMSWTRPWEASRRTGWHPHERWSFYFLNE